LRGVSSEWKTSEAYRSRNRLFKEHPNGQINIPCMRAGRASRPKQTFAALPRIPLHTEAMKKIAPQRPKDDKILRDL